MKISTKQLILISLFAGLTAIGAWLRIPIQPVPVTLQIFFTLMAGAVLGSIAGALSQLIYLFIGFLGIPVFAGGAVGFAALFGPTGGYLIGFVLAAYCIGFLIERLNLSSFLSLFLSMMVGLVLIYILGAAQLMVILKITAIRAFTVGILPFILLDLIKALLASLVAYRLRRLGIVES